MTYLIIGALLIFILVILAGIAFFGEIDDDDFNDGMGV